MKSRNQNTEPVTVNHLNAPQDMLKISRHLAEDIANAFALHGMGDLDEAHRLDKLLAVKMEPGAQQMLGLPRDLALDISIAFSLRGLFGLDEALKLNEALIAKSSSSTDVTAQSVEKQPLPPALQEAGLEAWSEGKFSFGKFTGQLYGNTDWALARKVWTAALDFSFSHPGLFQRAASQLASSQSSDLALQVAALQAANEALQEKCNVLALGVVAGNQLQEDEHNQTGSAKEDQEAFSAAFKLSRQILAETSSTPAMEETDPAGP